MRLPSGPSRTIGIGYRAFAGEPKYAATMSVTERVGAAVVLSITPRRATPDGSITISGHVDGPIPHTGVLVELLVYYRGRWEPFRDPTSSSRGDFRVRYQFEGAVGRFPFRAEAHGGQVGFPYTTARSNSVAVETG